MLVSPKPATDGCFKLTLEIFEVLSDSGHLAGHPVELLNGSLFTRRLQSPAHSYAVQELFSHLQRKLHSYAVLRTRLPLVLQTPPSDFLLPDLVLVKLPEGQYKHRNPANNDALWVMEVSDNTLERDRTEKLEAYARNFIPEYWILNVAANELEVYREPDGKNYLSKRILKPGQAVSPLAFSEIKIEWWL